LKSCELIRRCADYETEKNKTASQINAIQKMQFKRIPDQLVDVFYQLHRELFVDGKPYIDGNTNDLIALIW
jgi:hypothetical protein